MNALLLQERVHVLVAQRQEATDRLNQAMADLNAVNGAIQECQYWIARIVQVSADVPDKPEVTDGEG